MKRNEDKDGRKEQNICRQTGDLLHITLFLIFFHTEKFPCLRLLKADIIFLVASVSYSFWLGCGCGVSCIYFGSIIFVRSNETDIPETELGLR